MVKYAVFYTEEAIEDLGGIYEYLAVERNAPSAAAAQVKRLRDEIHTLDLFPKRCQVVAWEPWASLGMRQLPVGNFLVFYLVNDSEKQVMIDRILYGKRDIPNIVQ